MITASAQIGTPRGVRDSASISLDNGTSAKGTSKDASPKSKFHSLLEQYRASDESASETDDTQSATDPKRKDSGSATTVAVPQPVTQAAETPRLVLPFTTSFTLRQEAADQAEDKATQDATASSDDTATQDSTAAADTTALPSVLASTPSTLAILRSTLDLQGLPLVSDAKTNIGPKAHAQSKNPAPSQNSAAPIAQNAAAPNDQTVPAFSADPSIPIRNTSTILEQAAILVENSSTVNEAPYSASTSTSDRATAYQSRGSNDRPAGLSVANRASRESQKVSDPTQAVAAAVAVAIAVPIPLTVTGTAQPHLPAQPSTGSNTPQSAKALDKACAVPQDSSTASGTDSKNTPPPAIEGVDNTTAESNSGTLAFAARLTSTIESQPSAVLPASQTPLQTAAPVTAKQISIGTDLPADPHSGESGGQFDKEKLGDLYAKPETLLPQMRTAFADQTAAPASNNASATSLSPAAQMNKVIEPPTAAPKANNDITVRIPNSTGQDTAVRFVERAGEVHVSVRTGDPEMAQTLRGGLNDLANRLDNGGIRTEIWQPGAGSNAAFSQNDSHQSFTDPDGSNGRQHSSHSNSEQESKQQNKPRWVEELEGSIGNLNSKETPQLLWQA